jgi:hypothetical protein
VQLGLQFLLPHLIMSKRMIGIIALVMLVDLAGLQSHLHAVPAAAVSGEGGTSRSRSRQFIIHGKDGHTRGAFCVFCEDVKDDFLGLLGQPDRWRSPIVLQLSGHTTAISGDKLIRPKIFQLAGGGLRLQADIEISDGFTAQLLREGVIRLLLAELILRSHSTADFKGQGSLLPEWLSVGVTEAIEYRRQGRPTELASSILRSGKIISVTDIISADSRKINSISREIYRASCCYLIRALVGQDEGSMKMGRMIGDLAVFRGSPQALLEKHFPGIDGSHNSLEKWWVLELASIAQPTVKDILDPLKSERALGDSLKIRYVEQERRTQAVKVFRNRPKMIWSALRLRKKVDVDDKKSLPANSDFIEVDIADYRQFINHPERVKLLADIEVKLLRLSYRAFPLHRLMIQEYQVILTLLAKGKTAGIDEKLAKLAAARADIASLTEQATDYVNWYEATQVNRRSGAFTAYKKVFEDLNRPLPPRRDGLSEYLDDLDKEFRRD